MFIKKENNNIVIEIAIDELEEKQEDSPYMPLVITNRQKMIDWVLNNLLSFKFEDDKTGLSEFELFLDRLLTNAYSQGESWLQGLYSNNKKEIL